MAHGCIAVLHFGSPHDGRVVYVGSFYFLVSMGTRGPLFDFPLERTPAFISSNNLGLFEIFDMT